ncbi:MAG: pilus assembly protein TadG-related protein [Azospirillaceae bacterium]|nr:pilus assembly protein TadG-related protein [Azospirillaceae bacterium]
MMKRHCRFGRLRFFAQDRSGAVVLIVALLLLPLMGCIGLALDYENAMVYKGKLDRAADAAALQTLVTAQSYVLANQNQPFSQATQTATDAGKAAFNANAGSLLPAVQGAPTIALTMTGQTLTTLSMTATASYWAQMPTTLGRLFHVNLFNLSGSASSSMNMATYVNYYVLVDVSGSMGLPISADGQSRLAAINPDDLSSYPSGCVFACHFSGNSGYSLSRTNKGKTAISGVCPAPDALAAPSQWKCIQLRLDAVASALKNFMTSAIAVNNAAGHDQIGVGLFPFIVHMQNYQAITTDLVSAQTAADGIPNLLDTGVGSGALGSGGTHFDNAFSELSKIIPNDPATGKIGTGLSAQTPVPIVFFITDGAQDNQTQNNGSWSGSNHATTISASTCKILSNRNITLYILYIPYATIQNPNSSFAGNEDGYANDNIKNIYGALQSCASPGDLFSADSSTDVNAKIQAMFAQSLQSIRLVQ